MEVAEEELTISDKYESLFRWPEVTDEDDPLYVVDTAIVTGGRNSQKSFAVGTATCVMAKDWARSVLYTRYTLTATQDSIVPEFKEKIDLLNCESSFDVLKDRVIALDDEGNEKAKIAFKGIKTSSGNQTASLKSLKGFSVFVLDEAEEMPDYSGWDKIKKSIRAEKRNLNVIILNPTTKEHWIYKEFFEERGVPEGFNGIVGNVLYIHSSYLDMQKEHIAENLLADFEESRLCYEDLKDKTEDEILKLEVTHPRKVKLYRYYKHVVLGGWLDKAEGVIFTNWRYGEFEEVAPSVWGQDFGFSTDPTTLVQTSIDKKRKRLYVKLHLYKPKLKTSEIYEANSDAARSGLIYADSAEPRLISELKGLGNNIKATIKGQGSITAGIAVLQDFNEIIVDPSSVELGKEFNNYVWHDKKSKIPVDAFNHAIDAIRYAVYPQYAKKKREIYNN
ncbi:phage terminase large subunit [Sphingobacterium sp. UT-1RO-CII-1]|uniref:PBSX family phage terminase large subunit n=1 Tax=Sphingobacterium sp. UT-1RO-CII-1 TaxID=2995225 RepID=UPI00227C6ADB|nr:phage terminase large subunit [Sphingobacterium sp. UT-1RO-CII-1]MCY4779502.1 phage terminase large subunit [Sphingobacterium sp. UT-1RO-CII-1]